MHVMSRYYVMAVVFSFSPIAFAQTSDTRHVIAVEVDSADPRIQEMLPSLSDRAVKVVEESARNVRAIVVTGSATTRNDAARRNSADYVLNIELAIRPSAGFPPNDGSQKVPTTTADVPTGRVPLGITHSRCADLLGEFTYSYSVVSLTGKNIKLQDSHTMRENEYPLGPQLECLEKLSRRAVEVEASAAVHKLKSKKAL